MIDADIHQLNEQSGRSLDTLEADIWSGVDARIKAQRESRVVFSCQATILAIALLSSIAIGSQTTMAENSAPVLGIFSAGGELSPSARLIGR